MATVKFDVNTDRLAYDLNEMESMLRIIGSDMEELNTEINALSSMWSGKAKDTFLENFNETFGLVVQALDENRKYLQQLEEDKDKYNNCEADVTLLMQRI